MQVELIRQILSLGLVIAGFSFTVAMQLISLNKSHTTIAFSIVIFTISSIAMLLASWSSALILIASAGGIYLPRFSDLVIGVAVFSFLIGIFTFLVGIVFSGFIYNRNIGIVCLLMAIFATLTMAIVGDIVFR